MKNIHKTFSEYNSPIFFLEKRLVLKSTDNLDYSKDHSKESLDIKNALINLKDDVNQSLFIPHPEQKGPKEYFTPFDEIVLTPPPAIEQASNPNYNELYSNGNFSINWGNPNAGKNLTNYQDYKIPNANINDKIKHEEVGEVIANAAAAQTGSVPAGIATSILGGVVKEIIIDPRNGGKRDPKDAQATAFGGLSNVGIKYTF